jgi:SAM-dependent methyltransferase
VCTLVTKEEIERFVKETKFRGYQGLTLPYDIKIPGKDLSYVIKDIFPESLSGKSVLDIGCDYGFFLYEALYRGAARVIGVEADLERFNIAKEIARIKSENVEILFGDIMKIPLEEKFDIVLFLNVLHHISEPIAIMKKLASLCRGTIIVEFCTPTNIKYLSQLDSAEPGIQSLWSKLSGRILSMMLKFPCSKIPLMAVGNKEYHHTFYFTEAAFRNLFCIHHKLFKKIEFKPSLRKKHRVLAFCYVDT